MFYLVFNKKKKKKKEKKKECMAIPGDKLLFVKILILSKKM